MMYNLDLSRLLSKWRVIAPAILICAANVYADCADCESYKTQVASDCDSIISSCDAAIFDCQTAVSSAQTFATYYGSNTTERAALIQVAESASRASGTLSTLKTFAQSIKSTAQSLQCNASSDNGSTCDCSQYLQSLISLLTSCNQTVSGIKSGLDSVNSALGSPDDSDSIINLLQYSNEWLEEFALIFERFFKLGPNGIPINIAHIYGAQTNLYNRLLYDSTLLNVGSLSKPIYWRMSTGGTSSVVRTSDSVFPQVYSISASARKASLFDIVYGGFWQDFQYLSSLNNFAYSNTVAIASIASKLYSSTNTASNALLDYIVEVDRSPLDGVSSQYFAHLTNEYLATWSANDNPNTNWFRRVELLLASMVFRDSGHQDQLDEIEEGLPSSSDLSSLENSLDASELFDVDIGGQFFDNAPSLPEFGTQLPQTLVITIPSFGDDNSQSASSAHTIEIDVNSISSLCDAVRACFRFLWWGLVALLVFFLGRWFLRGCSLAFRLIQGVHFS